MCVMARKSIPSFFHRVVRLVMTLIAKTTLALSVWLVVLSYAIPGFRLEVVIVVCFALLFALGRMDNNRLNRLLSRQRLVVPCTFIESNSRRVSTHACRKI